MCAHGPIHGSGLRAPRKQNVRVVPSPKVHVQLKSFSWSCACSDAVGEEGRNAKLLDAPVQLGKKLKGSEGWPSVCQHFVSSSSHPLFTPFLSISLSLTSYTFPSILPHYFTLPLHSSTPTPSPHSSTHHPFHLTPPTLLFSFTSPPLHPSPLHPSPLHPSPYSSHISSSPISSLCTPPPFTPPPLHLIPPTSLHFPSLHSPSLHPFTPPPLHMYC